MTFLDPSEPVVGSVRKTLGQRSIQRRKKVLLCDLAGDWKGGEGERGTSCNQAESRVN